MSIRRAVATAPDGSVEAVVQESVIRKLIPQMMDLGATGIVEYPLNKVI